MYRLLSQTTKSFDQTHACLSSRTSPRVFARRVSGVRRQSDPGVGLTRLVLAVPVVEDRAGARQQDALALHVSRAELAAVGVVDQVGRNQGREHEHSDRRLGPVADLMGALLSTRERDDVTLPQVGLAL